MSTPPGTAEAREPLDGSPLDVLLRILDLEQVEEDIFRGRSPRVSLQRVFGGQVAGQALVAAGRTLPSDAQGENAARTVHSLHAYFLRGGDPEVPIVYLVDRSRDGQSFSVRRVVAVQHGRPIFTLSASFQRPGDGLDHAGSMPDAPDPESLPSLAERYAPYREQLPSWWTLPRPIDIRHVEPLPSPEEERQPRAARQMVWMRADGTLPNDPLLHACVATYASDMTLLDSALLPHGRSWVDGGIKVASLDHALWFHRPFRADEWLLYVQESPSAAGARAFCQGRIFTPDGRLVMSVAQEGMLRLTH